ncbi:MAG: family 10 glycosylhydrolase, partial [Chloroflexi bacterium]|nr:family 10 glycosylhydrolase [Chloroflexota bacterium]
MMNLLRFSKAFQPATAATFCAFFTLLVPPGGRAASPAAASADTGRIEDGPYAGDTEARAAWRPMDGTAPVSVALRDGHQALRLPCNFAGTRIERASWDRPVALDLTACRGIEFQMFCRDASPVSYFSFYLQSGEGWYHATFYPESSGDWNTVTLDKAAFGTEGKPAGWGRIRTIRVSAWRGQDRDTELWMRGLRLTGTLGRDALVAIVRGESAGQHRPEEARNVAQFAERMAQMVQTLGVGCAVVSDLDVTAEQLQAAKVVILPHNPSLPDRAAEALHQYAQNGGKLLVFYTVPDQLQGILKVQNGRHVKESRPGYFAAIRPRDHALPGAPPLIGQRSWNINSLQPVAGAGQVLAEWLDDQGQPTGHAALVGSTNALVMTHVLLPDDAERKRRFLLAMLGYLAPDLWPPAAQTSFDRVGVIGTAANFDEAAALLNLLATDKPRARETLASARALRDAAQELLARRQFPAAMDQAGAAQQRLTEAWCLAQPSLPGEFRAFWCHSAFGVEGLSWDEAIRRLAADGFTAILPNMLWGGAAFYESRLLPVSPEVAKRGDQIALCLAAARRHGLQVHVWKVNWNLGHAAPRAFIDQMRRAGRLQVSSRGQEEPWLCPSHPENQKLEIESMLEVARNYGVDGLHFDYIRYPDGDHCFCAGCKERFQQAAKTTLADWPRDVLAGGELRPPWLEWWRGNITAVVRAVSEQAHALRPNLRISAAVFRNWATDRDGVGQDWKLWCERGWLDFVCPMDYTSSPRQFENMVARQVDWAGRTPCYPGIGESASSSRLSVDGVIEQIRITRRHNTRGFV